MSRYQEQQKEQRRSRGWDQQRGPGAGAQGSHATDWGVPGHGVVYGLYVHRK
ncbi:hypothetical protein I79_012134 [Cricetulus griseus]|uniref:Uncharacterized protein n=1 Tax=Cricetulus griseus TaxID=10029 RepID=G3HN05_CRIGR|nr:hypothetical protein I79_012134 [Cricetulus griseus]